MSHKQREQRLLSDLEALRALKADSTIFDFETSGDPPERYTLTFRGKGLQPDSSAPSDVAVTDFHQCDLRLSYSYPERPPDVRWLTPVLHPNISFSGCIHLRDIGLDWTPELGLDNVCERLWDVARMAHHDHDKATNYSAKNWIEKNPDYPLPVDPRPLRDKAMTRVAGGNVVRYQRLQGGKPQLSQPASAPASEVLFIGDDAPAAAVPPAPERPRRRPAPANDGDILYIEE